MKEIESREDVRLLINTFYGKVRQDDMLGPIFNKIIQDWDTHLELLTDFWQTNLFFVQKYKGNPLVAHQKADKEVGGIISEEHFGRWLQLWFSTIDSLFVGEKAQAAKDRARKMSTMLFLKIFEARQ